MMSAQRCSDYFVLNDRRHFPPIQSRIDDLDDALLELIFTRLVQWRHLVTCKCVSKRWNSIISNPYFVRNLTNKHSPFTLIFRQEWTHKNEYTVNHSLITEHPYFQRHHNLCLADIIPNSITNVPSADIGILASHDDMLVLCRYSDSIKLDYYIVNPLTKQFIIVPVTCHVPPPAFSFDYWTVGFCGVVSGVSTIHVSNSKSIKVRGFRIIRINTRFSPYPNISSCQIYSSETGKWKTYTVNDLGCRFRGVNPAVTLNNRVHWYTEYNQILVIDPFVDDIFSYCVINLPSEIQSDGDYQMHNSNSVFGSCKNRLRIAKFESNEVDPRIKVWEFEDYEELMNWGGNTMAKLRLVIDFALLPHLTDSVLCSPSIPCCNRYAGMVCCHPNDPEIVHIIYCDKILQCDITKSRLKVIRQCTTHWSKRFMLVHPLMTP